MSEKEILEVLKVSKVSLGIRIRPLWYLNYINICITKIKNDTKLYTLVF